jgi:hypothetical protein
LMHGMNELFNHGVICPAEVEIGNVDYGSDAISFSGLFPGTMTRKEDGRVR